MKKLLVTFLSVVGALTILGLGVALVFALGSALAKSRVPTRTVLEIDLESPLLPFMPNDPFSSFTMRDRLEIRDVVEGIAKASRDPKVAGLYATIGASGQGMATCQEIRDAVRDFRATGKFAVAFSEGFGEGRPGNGGYYLATAFDPIWLQPSGDVALTGLIWEEPFVKGALDKLGLTARMDHRREYKNAMNTLTEAGFTAAHKEASQAVMESWFGQIVKGIAEARKLKEDEVRALVDRGPFLGQEAKDAGLVDGLGYRDEVLKKVKERAGSGAQLLQLRKYLDRAGRLYDEGETIALIYGVGAVQRGKGGYDPIGGDFVLGSDSVRIAFREALADKAVKAILFRVDSPGGSYVASDTVWRETVRAREEKKPVVVSMGNVAGSGGYFVAMDAAKIVAEPGTITGSIGVVSGKFLTSAMWDKLGVSWDEVHTSAHADMFTGTRDYSPEQWQRFQASLDRVYTDFTAKVAAGRHMALEQVQEVAKGRIWTGEDAKRLGLVDELGGFEVAVRLAREAAGIAAGKPVKLKVFPPRKRPFEALLAGGEESGESAAVSAALTRMQPVLKRLHDLGVLGPDTDTLSMPLVPPNP